MDTSAVKKTLGTLSEYSIVLTRGMNRAKRWLREKARGSERYGMVVSSSAERLKPYAIDVKPPMNPYTLVPGRQRGCALLYYLEQVATEFHIRGLELDRAGVTWDANIRAPSSSRSAASASILSLVRSLMRLPAAFTRISLPSVFMQKGVDKII